MLNDNGVKAVCGVKDETGGICGLKNIAVTPGSQRQGYGKRLITYLVKHYAGKYTQIRLMQLGELSGGYDMHLSE